jgi:hypothetical protein
MSWEPEITFSQHLPVTFESIMNVCGWNIVVYQDSRWNRNKRKELSGFKTYVMKMVYNRHWSKLLNTGHCRHTLFCFAFSRIGSFILLPGGAAVSYPRPNFRACYLRPNLLRLVTECDADDKISVREQFNTKMTVAVRVPFLCSDLQECCSRV